MRRIRNRVPNLQGASAPPTSSDPPGSSLTVDDIGSIEIILAESLATPTDAVLFDMSVLSAETATAPTDVALFDLAVATSDSVAAPVDATSTFDLDLQLAEAPATPTDTALFDLAVQSDETSTGPTETSLFDLVPLTETSATPTGGHSFQVAFPATGTWVCPAGVTSVAVDCWGGGKGGNNGTVTQGGSGGTAGDYAGASIAVSPGVTYTVTVGSGGASNAGLGGDSWFNTSSTVLAKGGGSASTNIGTTIFTGGAGAAGTLAGAGGGGGGGAGTAGNGSGAGTAPNPGAGGASDGGTGGTGGAAGSAGSVGGVRGGGGGGGGFSATSPGAGGVGGRGEVRLTYTVPDRISHIAYDGFERTNSTTSLGSLDSGQAWTVLAGTWGINGGQAYISVTLAGDHNAAVVDAGVSDCFISIKQISAAQESGIVFRATDNNNYLIFTVGGGQAGAVYKRVAGTFTQIASTTGTAADGDIYTVSLSGSSISVFRNGASIGSLTNTTNQTATKHGMRIYSSTAARIEFFDLYT